MNEPATRAEVEAAEGYEALFVPALVGQWTSWVCEGAALGPGDRVLDVACGTGVLAREASRRVHDAGSAGGAVAGLDLSPGMLAVAARLEPRASWRQGSAEAMPFADGSFDAVVSQFGLMFFTDRARAAGEMMRVLAPGGRLSVAVWGSLEENAAYAASVALLDRLAGREAAEALRAPFSLGDALALEALFRERGARSIEVTSRRGSARFASIRTMMEADLRGWLPLCGIQLSEERIERILEEAPEAIGPHLRGGEPCTFECTAHRVTAVRS